MKIIGKNDLTVGLSVVVGIFENNQLVLWLGISDPVVRIAFHGGDPEAPFVIKGKLHRIF